MDLYPLLLVATFVLGLGIGGGVALVFTTRPQSETEEENVALWNRVFALEDEAKFLRARVMQLTHGVDNA